MFTKIRDFLDLQKNCQENYHCQPMSLSGFTVAGGHRGKGQGRTQLLSNRLSSCTEVCLLVQQCLAFWGRLVSLCGWMVQSSYREMRPGPCPPPSPEKGSASWVITSLSWCWPRRRHLGGVGSCCSVARGQQVWGRRAG